MPSANGRRSLTFEADGARGRWAGRERAARQRRLLPGLPAQQPEDDGFGWPRSDGLKWPHFGGTDTFVRQPLASPLTKSAGEIGVFSRLYVWDDTLLTWRVCREGGWVYNSVASDSLARTFNWGTAPCGVKFYTAVGWAAHWNTSTSSWVVSPAVDPGDEGGQNLGLAVGGKLWNLNRSASLLSLASEPPDLPAGIAMPPVRSVRP
jgi:hypothetical protein